MRTVLAILAMWLLTGAGVSAVAAEASAYRVSYRGSELSAAPGGPAIELKEMAKTRHLQVVTADDAAPVAGEFIQVRVSSDPEIFLWVRTTDLQTVMLTTTFVHARAKDIGREVVASTPGVWLRPGTRVTVQDQKKNAARVLVNDGELRVSGWVPTTSLGKVYQRLPEPIAPEGAESECLSGTTELLATPGGAAVAIVSVYDYNKATALADWSEFPSDAAVIRLGAPRKGHVLVKWAGRRATVVGWVPESRLMRQSRREGGWGFGRQPDVVKHDIPAGTPVLDMPGGTVVGRFTKGRRHEVLEQRDGASMIRIETSVGTASLWVPIEVGPMPARPAP